MIVAEMTFTAKWATTWIARYRTAKPKTEKAKHKKMPSNRAKRPVPARYTLLNLKRDLAYAHATMSLRAMARDLSGKTKISHRIVQEILAGKEPKRADIRRQLGLPELGSGRICPKHGIVHDRMCRAENPSEPPRPRRNWKAFSGWVFLAMCER